MSLKRILLTGLTVAAITSTSVFAAGHSTGNKAVDARIAHMNLYSFNLGQLGAMAKGSMDFNADLATALASDLAALSSMSQAAYWPEGTSSDDVEGSRALAAGWEDPENAMKLAGGLAEASAALAEAAGTLEGLQGAIGAVGGACGACHKATRGPAN